ncbi:MAG: helix-turn-helix transcriptional regulator [Dehalococcoidales bacterium]|nr:helix-turn-helix transcriptional regulator [Dehalococcoidales bacterium]
MNTQEIGKHIALLRKERGLTQEKLAEALSVSPQAVSKWENGHSLPETLLLPRLARILDCSIDNILMVNNLQILDAIYGDGLENENVTKRLNRLVEDNGLSIKVDYLSIASNAARGRKRYLLVKYQNDTGVSYCVTADNEDLSLDNSSSSKRLPSSKLEIITASYGNEIASNDVLHRIRHMNVFETKGFQANHTYFPSTPMVDSPEYLTIVYLNKSGIRIATCAEGEILRLTEDRTELIREVPGLADSCVIRGVDLLPGFGQGMDCTWAGALTVALRAMGETVSYVKVMGVSGACWRIAFTSPNWDYSSADALIAYNYAEPGYNAFGYTPQITERVEKKYRVAERSRIVDSINQGQPVLGINLRVAHEWGVICGYEDNGNRLLCRTYFDDRVTNSPDFDNKSVTEEKYLYVDNWPFIITYFGQKGIVPTDYLNLLNSLKVLVDSMNGQGERGYSVGYDAYRVWQADLRDDEWFVNADDEQFGRRLDVNYFCLDALLDARQAAFRYLQSSLGLIENDRIKEIAAVYEQISNILSGLLPDVPGLDSDLWPDTVTPKNMRKAWTPELRHRQADLFDEIIALEKKGEEIARKIIHMETSPSETDGT